MLGRLPLCSMEESHIAGSTTSTPPLSQWPSRRRCCISEPLGSTSSSMMATLLGWRWGCRQGAAPHLSLCSAAPYILHPSPHTLPSSLLTSSLPLPFTSSLSPHTLPPSPVKSPLVSSSHPPSPLPSSLPLLSHPPSLSPPILPLPSHPPSLSPPTLPPSPVNPSLLPHVLHSTLFTYIPG